MISVAARSFAANGKPNRHAFHDVGAAASEMTIQATALAFLRAPDGRLQRRQGAGTYGIPDTHEAVAAIAVGYLGDPDALPDDLRERELKASTRKPIGDFVFTGKWGQSASWTR